MIKVIGNKVIFQNSESCSMTNAVQSALKNNVNFAAAPCSEVDNVIVRTSGGELLRFEALQTQLNELSAYVKTIKSCKCDLEKALADYLTQDEASKTYETIEAHLASIQLLQNAIDRINVTFGNIDTTKGTVAEQLTNQNVLILQLQNTADHLLKSIEAESTKISAMEERLDALETTAKCTIPYTATQLSTLLAKLEKLQH